MALYRSQSVAVSGYDSVLLKATFTILVWVLLLAMLGCAGPLQSQTASLSPPSVAAQIRHYFGTPLSGPTVVTTPVFASDAPRIDVQFFALEKMSAAGEPLGPHVRLVIAGRENQPVLPSGRLTLGVRVLDSAAGDNLVGSALPIANLSGVLLPGATAAFSIAEIAPGPDLRRVELDFYHSSSATEKSPVGSAIAIDDFVNNAPPPEIEQAFAANRAAAPARNGLGAQRPPPPPPAPQVFESELALFDRSAPNDAFALIVPIRLNGSDAQAVLAVVHIGPNSRNSEDQALVAQATQQIQASSQAAADQANLIGADPPDWPGLSAAVQALAYSDRQRAGLVFLADQTRAGITEDMALAADDTVLSRLADSVAQAIAAAPLARDRAAIGWILERSTYELLLHIQSGGKLPPELAAILATRAGQAGRASGTLEEVLANAGGEQDMDNRLAAENYIFLEDSSPAARVRAFDWLTVRHLAPPGYAPLDTPANRRRALEAAEQSASGGHP